MGTQDTRGSWDKYRANRAFPFVKAHKGECPIFLPETLIIIIKSRKNEDKLSGGTQPRGRRGNHHQAEQGAESEG